MFNKQQLTTIYKALGYALDQAVTSDVPVVVDSIENDSDAAYQLRDIKRCMDAVDDAMMMCDVQQVKSLLEYCCCKPDATITIAVQHDDGQQATAVLYDHAALVQGLIDALQYFIEQQ